MKIESRADAEKLAAGAPRGMSTMDALSHVYGSQQVHDKSHTEKHPHCIFCKE